MPFVRYCMYLFYLTDWIVCDSLEECRIEYSHPSSESSLLQRYATPAALAPQAIRAGRSKRSGDQSWDHRRIDENDNSSLASLGRSASWSERRNLELLAVRQVLDRAAQIDALMPNVTNLVQNTTEVVRKVAFLFLVRDAIENEEVWDSFFETASIDKYSIYVHRASPGNETSEPLRKWGAVSVPRVPSAWCALSGAEAAVFSEALANQANTQFALISDSTVPLKSFQYMYSQLVTKSSNTSKLCFSYDAAMNALKHHQWVVLSRQHAFKFVQNSEAAVNTVYQDSLGDGRECCSDEVVVTAALFPDADKPSADEYESRHGIEKKCLTWVSWGDDLKGTNLELSDRHGMPQQFGPPEDDPTIKLNYLRMLVTEEGFMFGRKFNQGCLVDLETDRVPLSAKLPSLWEEVDAEKASSRIWSLLTAEGLPQAPGEDGRMTPEDEPVQEVNMLALSSNISRLPESRHKHGRSIASEEDARRQESGASSSMEFWYGTLFAVGMCSVMVFVDAVIYPSE
mmetsp:Transcript_41072/g.64215  ORF Transcript_41072/g.64215 Transcript_41072/m.64215 type:complete len:513 (-) Transcript_41072:51-1589(-)